VKVHDHARNDQIKINKDLTIKSKADKLEELSTLNFFLFKKLARYLILTKLFRIRSLVYLAAWLVNSNYSPGTWRRESDNWTANVIPSVLKRHI